MSAPSRRFPLTARIVTGLAVGLALGLWLGPRAGPLGEVGKVVIGWIKLLAGPFMAVTILKAVVETPLRRSEARHLLSITSINALLALSIGLGLASLFRPGTAAAGLAATAPAGAPAWQVPSFGWAEWTRSLAPRSLLEPLLENAILSLAVLSVLVGAALRSVLRALVPVDRQRLEPAVIGVLELARATLLRLLEWSVELAPVAVGAMVAKAVGEKGLSGLVGLWPYLVVGAAGLMLQTFVVYLGWVRWAGIPVRTFWQAARRPVVYSLGVNSSLATLPLTLQALGELKIRPKASALGACIGTNLNNDGILLYEAMAVLFVAQAHGIDLTLGAKLAVVGLCWLATVGIGGVPEAGFVSLSVILTQVHLPLEILPFLLSVDWVLARMRSATNVVSDMATSIVIDRWMAREGTADSTDDEEHPDPS